MKTLRSWEKKNSLKFKTINCKNLLTTFACISTGNVHKTQCKLSPWYAQNTLSPGSTGVNSRSTKITNAVPAIIQVEASEVRHMAMSALLCLEHDAAPPCYFLPYKIFIIFFHPITNFCWKFSPMVDSLTLSLISLKMCPRLSVPWSHHVNNSAFKLPNSAVPVPSPPSASWTPIPAPWHFNPFWSCSLGLTPLTLTEKPWDYYLNTGIARSPGFGSLRLYTSSRNQLMDSATVPKH